MAMSSGARPSEVVQMIMEVKSNRQPMVDISLQEPQNPSVQAAEMITMIPVMTQQAR
jgi:hypothetical protein